MKNLSSIIEGMFDVEDNANDALIEIQWGNCFKIDYIKQKILDELSIDLSGNVLTVSRKNSNSNSMITFPLDQIQDFCENHGIKKIVWDCDFLVFTCSKTWTLPIEFVVDRQQIGVSNCKVKNIKIVGKSVWVGNGFGDGCTVDSTVTYVGYASSPSLYLDSLNTKCLVVDWQDFAYDIDNNIGAVATEEGDWRQYLFDVKMPVRKEKFVSLMFKDIKANDVMNIIKGKLINNPKHINAEEILIYFQGGANKQYTLRVRKNDVEICKGQYLHEYKV